MYSKSRVLSTTKRKHVVHVSSKRKADAMRKKQERCEVQDLELLKAVAQAWHAQTGNPKPTKESDAQKNNFKYKPSRFRLEAMGAASKKEGASWDFAQSLWDSYEIVTLSKKLESSLALDHPLSSPPGHNRHGKRPRESRNSLRKLLGRYSSKRFDGDIPLDEGDHPSRAFPSH